MASGNIRSIHLYVWTETDSEEEDERYKSGYQNGNAYYVSLSVFLESYGNWYH